MPNINCPIVGCEYATGEVEASIAAALLMVHGNVHKSEAPSGAVKKHKPPKLDRPDIGFESTEES